MSNNTRSMVPGIWSDVYTGLNDQGNASLRVTALATPDFMQQVALGLVPGVEREFKFARIPSATTTELVVWDNGGSYNFVDTPETMSVASDNVNDTNGGDGAWDLVIYGLDTNLNPLTETITMAGTTPVVTTNSYARFFRAVVYRSGLPSPTNDTNLGNITFTGNTTSTVRAQINANNGQTLMSQYTVKAGFTALIIGATFNVGQGKQCLFRGKARDASIPNGSFSSKYSADVFENTVIEKFRPPLVFPEKSDFVITAQMETGTASVNANYKMLLFDNDIWQL